MHDPLKAQRRPRLDKAVHDKIVQLVRDEGFKITAQEFDIHIAGTHHRGRILILGQGKQQMFQHRKLMAARSGEGHGTMQSFFK